MKTAFGKSFRLAAALLCLLILTLGLSAAAFAVEFTDAAGIGTPYRTAVDSMADKGILNGFPDGSFLPDGTLTREQGAKMLLCCLILMWIPIRKSPNRPGPRLRTPYRQTLNPRTPNPRIPAKVATSSCPRCRKAAGKSALTPPPSRIRPVGG